MKEITGNAIISGFISTVYWFATVLAEVYGLILPKPVNMIVTLLIALGFAYKSYKDLYWDIILNSVMYLKSSKLFLSIYPSHFSTK